MTVMLSRAGAEDVPAMVLAVALDVPAPGAPALGGTRAHTPARAGRISAADPAVLQRFDAACAADREPYTGTRF